MAVSKESYSIVVAIDYSESSALALEQAFELAAQRSRAVIHAINVMPVQPEPMVDVVSEVFNAAAPLVTRAAEQLKSYVAKKADEFRKLHPGEALTSLEGIVVHQRLVAPAEEVAQLAADLEADLVIVGTHGRRGMPRLVLGSVAEAVVRLAPCPVLVVRPKKLAAPQPVIEPPCPRCLEARKTSGGKELWCEQHRERHGQRHTYHQSDRVGADTNLPLVVKN